MQNETAKHFNAHAEQIAKQNGVASAETTFEVAQAVELQTVTANKEAAVILGKINFFPVEITEGHAVGAVSTAGTIAARTDITSGPRIPREAGRVDTRTAYKCERTEYDAALPYSLLDAWAHLPDFRERMDKAIGKRRSLDRLMIGLNGTEVAVASDRTSSPRLQDVNIGWLEKVRTRAPEQVKAEGSAASGKVTIEADGDYKSLDALVFAAVQMLDEHQRQRDDLVVILNRELINARLLASAIGDSAGETALSRIVSTGRIAGIKYHEAPFFPDAALLVTTFDNLSVYYQKGSVRRFIRNEPENDQVCDFLTVSEAFVVEDYGLAALVENIEFT